MLSRRLIRLKVFKILFSKTIAEGDTLRQAENELMESCTKTVELYAFLLSLPVELKRVAEQRIEIGLQKFNPTPEEANPNRKFVENSFISLLENDVKFKNYLENNGLTWAGCEDVVKELFKTIQTRDYYKEYMAAAVEAEADRKLIRRIFEDELEDNLSLYNLLEERSVLWRDDIEFVLNVILQRLSSIQKEGKVTIPDTFAQTDDCEFAKRLLSKSIINYDDYAEEIEKNLSQWDLERLVKTDLVLIVMAMTEAESFETIPVKVTINEYVSIAKFYGNANSCTFVNGILDKTLEKMVKDGTIRKSGRGLVGGFKQE